MTGMEELTLTYDNSVPMSEQEEKTVREIEKSLNGLKMAEAHRILARVISMFECVIYRPHWQETALSNTPR